jgi:hypothetical protein
MLLANGYVRFEDDKYIVSVKAAAPQTEADVIETLRREKVEDAMAVVVGNPRSNIFEVTIGPKGVSSREVPASGPSRADEGYAKNLVKTFQHHVGQVLRN